MSNGKGAFCHPPISVVDDNEESNLEKPSAHKTRKARFSQNLTDSIQVVVTDDGFIGLIMDGSDDEILKFLNALISTMLSKGQRSLFVSDSDLCSFDYDFDKQTVVISNSEVFSLRNRFEFERDSNETYSLWRETPRDTVSMKVLAGWFTFALKFYQNEELRNYLLLLGESWGLSYGKMYKASFLYSWMIIETSLEQFWKNHIDSLNLVEPEKDIFRKKVKNISNIIEVLKKLSKIDEKTFQSIEKMRDLRNKLIHKMSTSISPDDAHNCLHVANEIIYNKFNQLRSPFVNIELVK